MGGCHPGKKTEKHTALPVQLLFPQSGVILFVIVEKGVGEFVSKICSLGEGSVHSNWALFQSNLQQISDKPCPFKTMDVSFEQDSSLWLTENLLSRIAIMTSFVLRLEGGRPFLRQGAGGGSRGIGCHGCQNQQANRAGA